VGFIAAKAKGQTNCGSRLRSQNIQIHRKMIARIFHAAGPGRSLHAADTFGQMSGSSIILPAGPENERL
jgi:hypothetical protein